MKFEKKFPSLTNCSGWCCLEDIEKNCLDKQKVREVIEKWEGHIVVVKELMKELGI